MEKSFSLPIPGILLLVFVLCKAFEYGPIAAWTWTWVLSPAWIPIAIIATLLAVSVLIKVVAEVLDR